MFKHLTKPIEIGTLQLKNRMVQPGMGTNLAAADGTVSDNIVDYYTTRAHGGVGLIITEVCCPEASGRVIPGELEISSNAFVPGLARLASAAHAGGAKIALQLAHGGCFASQAVTGQQPISPSGVGTMLLPDDTPREMTIAEIKNLIQSYAQAAQRARMAGFDAVEIHGPHGYMPLQYLTGYTNRRTDEYGGSFNNRARFSLEIIQAIKELLGPNFPVIYRLSAEEDVPDGVTLDEAIKFAKLAQSVGVDALHISAGTWDSRMGTFFGALQGQVSPKEQRFDEGVSIGMWVPPLYVPRGNLVPLAHAIKQNITIPVIAVCGISPEMGETIIAEGKADLISMGRQIIADPDYPRKIITNKPELIRRCVRCNECLGSVLSYRGFDCAVNAQAAKEHETYSQLKPATTPYRVMVVGGGPAGMEAARIATLRGHTVTLYEQNTQLGGMLRYAARPDFKKDYQAFLAWQIDELGRQGITVKTNTKVTTDLIKQVEPNIIIMATGATQTHPNIPGADKNGGYDGLAVLDGNIPSGKHIVICGTGLIGTEVAMFLAKYHNKQVTLVDQISEVVPEVEVFTRWVIQGQLLKHNIAVKLNHHIERILTDSIICTHNENKVTISADAVVLALGLIPNTTLWDEVKNINNSIEIVTVGDMVKPRRLLQAIHEGFHAGRRI